MGGELFFAASAEEVKRIKKDPGLAARLAKKSKTTIDMDITCYSIDAALTALADERGQPDLSLAASGDKEIGDSSTPVKTVNATKVKSIARLLGEVSQDEFKEALCRVMGSCQEGDDLCIPKLQDLRDFYRAAAREKKAVVKTIY